MELNNTNLEELINEAIEKANENGYSDCDAYDIRIVREWEEGFEHHDYSGYDYSVDDYGGMTAFINEEHVTGACLDLYANYNAENTAYETDCGVHYDRATNEITTYY